MRGLLAGEAVASQRSFDLAPLSTRSFDLSNTPMASGRLYGTFEVVPHVVREDADFGLDARLLTNNLSIDRWHQGLVPFDRYDPILTRIRPDRVIDFDRLMLFHASSLGRVQLGWDYGPGELTAVSGPIDWGLGGYGGDFPYFFRKPQDVGFYSLSALGSANTSPRAAYYSPRVLGLQGAVSFQPDTRNTGFQFDYGGTAAGIPGRQFRNGSNEGFTAGFSNVVEAAVNYDDTIGPVRVRASAGVIEGTAVPSATGGPFRDLQSEQVGLSVSWAGWTAGAGAVFAGRSGYTIYTNPRQRANQFEINGGLQYDFGRWTVGAGGLYGDAAGDPTERSDTQLTVISGGFSYRPTQNWIVGLEVDRIRTLSADFGDYTNYLVAGQVAYRFDTD